jgi:16S rRNA (cytidine1402-2'-O)-methyltransferase
LILYAIPTPLGGSLEDSLPAGGLRVVRALRDFAVEDAKSARTFLKAAGVDPKAVSVTEVEQHADCLKVLREGRSLGLLSEAGCPAIADPGAASPPGGAHRLRLESVRPFSCS